MKFPEFSIKSILIIITIAVLLIPQTRNPIQIFFHGMLSKVRSVKADEPNERETLLNYDWKLIDASGEILDFNKGKDRVVFLNFWATWCPPCIAEMESLQKLYDNYNTEVLFLFVTKDSFDKVNQFMEKNDYSFIVYQPITDSSHLFDVTSIPRTFIIDRKGNIAIDKSGAVDWNSKKVEVQLKELLLE